MYASLYESVGDAKADLGAIEDLHRDELIGSLTRQSTRTRRERLTSSSGWTGRWCGSFLKWIGFGPLSRKELKEAATELTGTEAGLVMIGEPTLEKAFNKAVTHASKTVKRVFDATADELAQEMKEAVGR